MGEIVRERLLLTNTDLTSELLMSRPYDFEKPGNVREFMHHLIGSGLVNLEGEKHKSLRKRSLQIFKHRHIQALCPTMWRKALNLVDEMDRTVFSEKKGADDPNIGLVEMTSWAYKVTMDVIGSAVLGHDFGLLKNPENKFVQSYKAVTGPDLFWYRALAVWLSFEFVQKLPWKKNRVFKDNVASMKTICRQLIQDKKEEIRLTAEPEQEFLDILSLLIQTGDFTDIELAEQLLTYLIAGYVDY